MPPAALIGIAYAARTPGPSESDRPRKGLHCVFSCAAFLRSTISAPLVNGHRQTDVFLLIALLMGRSWT